MRGDVMEQPFAELLSECLGRVLVRERFISEAEYKESLKRMMASGQRQGAVLVEMGCISPQNLQYALGLQMRAKLVELFSWKFGEYQFNSEASLPPEGVGLEMSITALVYEERRVFAAIDGRKTVAELKALELLKESELDRLLYAMKCTRLVRLSEAPLTVHSRFDLQ